MTASPLIVGLSAWFALGAAFYFFRLFSPAYLRRVNGYFDVENEFWHGACLLGMVACLTPWVLPLPVLFWQVLFAVGTLWYLVRAYTWGKTRPFNKRWYDLAHAAMLGGMWWMFAMPVEHLFLTVAWAAYWTWFGGYYVYRVYNDFKKPHWLGFGQDIAHLTMAVVMVLMTIWPQTYMPYHDHGHHHHLPGDICGPGAAKPDVPAPELAKPDAQPGHQHHHH
ncbi:MAG: hypothetical protein K2Y32_23965 [Candidatus Obscuribacterales bacterium]|nr:hypothetical protein [Candidatus Obscuribacterales bacterium]